VCISNLLKGARSWRFEVAYDVGVIVRDRIYRVDARVGSIVHIRLVLVTRKEAPPAVFGSIGRFSVHVTDRHAVHRDAVRRQGAAHWSYEIPYLVGSEFELLLEWVGHVALLSTDERR